MRFLLSYIWAFVWFFIMLFLMLRTPGPESAPLFDGFDKLAHCGSFFLLTALILYGRVSNTKSMTSKFGSILIALVISGIFAFGTELAQHYFTSARQADWWDIFADFVGIGIALFSFILFYRKRF